MNRRDLLKMSGIALAAGGVPTTRLWAAPADYQGQFLIQMQVGGAWDVASYCDPKLNKNGKIVNNWAKTQEIKKAGNIPYAPFANNADLFEKHHEKMLVINGINCFTNGHSAGKQYNFTGSTQAGYPNLSAAFAATLRDDFPMPLLVNGGSFSSGDVIVPTRLGRDIETFNTLLEPNVAGTKQYLPDEDLTAIDEFRKKRARDNQASANIEADKRFFKDFLSANKIFPNFAEFKRVLKTVDTTGFDMKENLNQQMLYALVGFKSGTSVAADTTITAFDTHDDHDNRHAGRLTKANNGILLAWHVAEQLGITDRLNMFVASDFGRTPWYNDGGGKDHWPIGSTLIMKSGVNWTDRVVGKTDDDLKAFKLNPNNLRRDDVNGVTLESSHVMAFGRRLMGIENDPLMRNFDLRTEGVEFNFDY